MRSLRLVPLTLLALAAPLGAAGPAGMRPRTDRLGDPLPEGALARLGSARLRADGMVQCLAFTPDGTTLVSGGSSRHLTFWDAATGREVRRLTAPPAQVCSLQITADGKTLAVGGGDGVVRLLDADTGRERKALVDPMRRFGNVYAVLSPDGKTLAASAAWGSELLLWDVEGGRVRQRYAGFNGFYNAIPAAFTPDGKHLVAAWNDGKVHVVDAGTGKDLRALGGSAPPGTPAHYRIQALTVTPDGKRVALPDSMRPSLLLVDLASGKLARRIDKPTTYGYYGGTRALAFTPNGRFVVELGGSGASIQVWGVASGKLLRQLDSGGPYSSAAVLAVSKDGKRAATASNSAIHLWDVPGAKELHHAEGHQSAVTRVAFLADGRLVSVGGPTVRAWDVAAMKQVASAGPGLVYGMQSLSPTADGKGVRWLGSDRALYEWRPGADHQPRKVTSPGTTRPYGYPFALSPDARTMAVLDNTGKFLLVDLLKGGKERELTGKLVNRFGGPVIVFAPDGRRVALGTPDRVVRVWDVPSGAELRGLRPEGAPAGFVGTPRLEFSPDGRTLLALEPDGQLHGYEVAGGGERFRLPKAATPAQQFAWSPDGRLVAQAGADGVVSVHDVLTGKELLRRDGKQGGVQSLGFSADGRRLATGGTNTTVLVWEVPAPPPAAREKPDADAAWKGLADTDAGKAFRTVCALAAFPDLAAEVVRARLKPPAPAGARRVAKLIADLDNEDFEVRQKASEALEALGTEAEEALRKAATSPSPEVRNRAKKLLRKLSAGGVPVTRLRAVRAVEVLERAGTPPARALLKEMAKTRTEAAIEQEVRASLARLGEKE